jgi:hypothetical protein
MVNAQEMKPYDYIQRSSFSSELASVDATKRDASVTRAAAHAVRPLRDGVMNNGAEACVCAMTDDDVALIVQTSCQYIVPLWQGDERE